MNNVNKRISNSKPSTSRKSKDQMDTDTNPAIPLLKCCDNATAVPKYTAILTRNPDEGVIMDDLDSLQFNLERLVSTSILRQRFLLHELETIDRVTDETNGRLTLRQHLKRRRYDARTQRQNKRSYPTPPPLPTLSSTIVVPAEPNNSNNNSKVPITDAPKITLPKNETAEKFWATVEPYCARITPLHRSFIERLIQECGQEVDIKIPELGPHYTSDWTDTTLNPDPEWGNLKPIKNGLSSVQFSNSLTQRLLSVLIEERVMTNFPNLSATKQPPKGLDLNLLKTNSTNTMCLDRRLRKNLIDQGILTADDLSSNKCCQLSQNDEILTEIQKCQQELQAINEYNVEELKRLKTYIDRDLQRQEVEQRLEKVDGEILDVYNKIMAGKLKFKDQEVEESAAYKAFLKEHEDNVDKLLKQQVQLEKELQMF